MLAKHKVTDGSNFWPLVEFNHNLNRLSSHNRECDHALQLMAQLGYHKSRPLHLKTTRYVKYGMARMVCNVVTNGFYSPSSIIAKNVTDFTRKTRIQFEQLLKPSCPMHFDSVLQFKNPMYMGGDCTSQRNLMVSTTTTKVNNEIDEPLWKHNQLETLIVWLDISHLVDLNEPDISDAEKRSRHERAKQILNSKNPSKVWMELFMGLWPFEGSAKQTTMINIICPAPPECLHRNRSAIKQYFSGVQLFSAHLLTLNQKFKVCVPYTIQDVMA